MIATIPDRIRTAPTGVGSTSQGLTRSSGTSREGLAMKATRVCSIEGCVKSTKGGGLGWCGMHYTRHVRHGDPLFKHARGKRTEREALDTFWSKVAQEGECWVWTGAISDTGYGAFRYRMRLHSTHRFAYEQMVGEIPEGLHLDHLCRNTRCCNPYHLDPVTPAENNARKDQAYRTGVLA